MALKGIVKDISEVPESLREHYKQVDGGYLLDAEGLAPRAKLDEFRENNRKLHGEIEELKKRYEGLDPEEHKRLRAELEDVRAGKGETVGKLLSEEKRRLQEEYSSRLQRTTKERDELKASAETYRGRLSQRLLADEFRKIVEKEKIRLRSEGAFQDLLNRAAAYYQADPDTGKVSAKAVDSFDDVKSPSEWLRETMRDPLYGHYFADGEGSGAGGAGVRRGANGKLYLTREQLMTPTPEQLKAIKEGNYEIVG